MVGSKDRKRFWKIDLRPGNLFGKNWYSNGLKTLGVLLNCDPSESLIESEAIFDKVNK